MRLAPLTILVGENSTGKTSFMALVRIIWFILKRHRTKNFDDSIFPLGGFTEISFRLKKKKNQELKFTVKVQLKVPQFLRESTSIFLEVEFSEHNQAPYPATFRIIDDKEIVEICMLFDETDKIIALTSINGDTHEMNFGGADKTSLVEDYYTCLELIRKQIEPIHSLGTDSISVDQSKLPISELIDSLDTWQKSGAPLNDLNATAPIRSRPSRTYEQTGIVRDNDGAYVPEFLATTYKNDQAEWDKVKENLKQFGKNSGLFEHIDVAFFRDDNKGPFQVHFQNPKEQTKNFYNLIDMGYGVSQVLPVLAELTEEKAEGLFMLQQPEVHLHPRAQAELGSLFCRAASRGGMLLVETHSDYLLDRVRIDVRDRKTKLTHDMVSILFFVRKADGVDIKTLKLDENGNIIDAPHEYGEFFMDEKRKVLGL